MYKVEKKSFLIAIIFNGIIILSFNQLLCCPPAFFLLCPLWKFQECCVAQFRVATKVEDKQQGGHRQKMWLDLEGKKEVGCFGGKKKGFLQTFDLLTGCCVDHIFNIWIVVVIEFSFAETFNATDVQSCTSNTLMYFNTKKVCVNLHPLDVGVPSICVTQSLPIRHSSPFTG